MIYRKLLFFLFSLCIVHQAQAKFNPRLIVEIMDAAGNLRVQAQLRVFAPENSTINKFSNYLVPSKQEALETIAADYIQHPRITAYAAVALYEAYEKCVVRPFEKVDANTYKGHLNETACLAFYNFWKQVLILKIREKIDPYLKEGVKKIDITQNIKNRKLVAALGYIAHRSVNCTLDIACDAAVDLFKKRFVN